MNNNIVFDTTFCGDWAGGVWSQDSTCASQANTCQDYVMNNPSAYTEAYWTVNSLKVYTTDGQTSSPAPAPVAAEGPKVSSPVPVQAPPAPTPKEETPPPAPAPAAPKPSPSSPSQPAAGSTDGPMALRVGPDGSVTLGPPEKKRRDHARHLALHGLKHGRRAA